MGLPRLSGEMEMRCGQWDGAKRWVPVVRWMICWAGYWEFGSVVAVWWGDDVCGGGGGGGVGWWGRWGKVGRRGRMELCEQRPGGDRVCNEDCWVQDGLWKDWNVRYYSIVQAGTTCGEPKQQSLGQSQSARTPNER